MIKKSKHDINLLIRAGYRIYKYEDKVTDIMLNYFYHVLGLEVGYDEKEHLLFVKNAAINQ